MVDEYEAVYRRLVALPALAAEPETAPLIASVA
jgi:hypothetical protein